MSTEADQHSAEAGTNNCAAKPAARQLVEVACVEWQSDLKAFLLGILRDRHAVEDVYQRCVIRAMASAESARPESLRGWLFRVALNEARQLHREFRRDAVHFGRLAELRIREASDAGDDSVLTQERILALQQTMNRLPVDQREVIRRRIYQGQTFAEIALEMQVPIGTVLTWMRRGVQKLKDDVGLRSLMNGAADDE